VSVLDARLQPPFLLIEPLGAQQPGQEISVEGEVLRAAASSPSMISAILCRRRFFKSC